ncbi:hypothetical protein FA13DRAFT_31321 [Coprinellus micaceus]|uniref:Uncharacterized protein n=1 Tax=Coprinellus micaceus TaxID=71717 RepID=A0A4Y7U082_COPMI|nr:hypothetical protein FA13DRAFT_31321 [Coprinellus micaceus]
MRRTWPAAISVLTLPRPSRSCCASCSKLPWNLHGGRRGRWAWLFGDVVAALGMSAPGATFSSFLMGPSLPGVHSKSLAGVNTLTILHGRYFMTSI